MSNDDPPRRRFSWRDFKNRREPAALGVIVLLVLVTAGLVEWGVIRGFSIGAVISILLVLTVLLLNPFWSLPAAPAHTESLREMTVMERRRVWLFAIMLAVLAAWPRVECMDHSLTTEEVHLINPEGGYAAGHGETWFLAPVDVALPEASAEPDPSGEGWLGRIQPRIARLAARRLEIIPSWEEDGYELTGRAYPWLFGVLSPVLLVILGSVLGSTRAGLAAGLILAMHPLHIHWSAAASGKSTALFFLLVSLLCLISALRTNQWNWWITLAGAQAVAKLSHQAALFPLIALNLVAMAIIVRSSASTRDRRSHLLRLGMAITLTIVPLTLLYGLTLWPQPHNSFASLAGNILRGDTARASEPAPWQGVLTSVMLALCGAAGIWFMLRQDWRTRLVVLTLVVAAGGACAISPESAALPALVLLPLSLAWAGEYVAQAFPRHYRAALAPLFIAALFVLATAPVLRRTIALPLQPARDAVDAAHHAAGENSKAILFTFGADAVGSFAYAADASSGNGAADLSRDVEFASENQRPLFVYHTIRDGEMSKNAAIMRELSDGGRFQAIREFPAFDPALSYRLYQYHPREQIIRLNVKPEK